MTLLCPPVRHAGLETGSCTTFVTQMDAPSQAAIHVVLIHGLGQPAPAMWPLALYLRAAGLETRLARYPSTRLSVPEAIDAVRTQIGTGPVNLVGYSLGGLIAARLLREAGSPDIGRVVQLGSPNLGSTLADRLATTWPVQTLCGPAVADLRAHALTPAPDPRIGAIAGTSGRSTSGLMRPHDGRVSARSAWAGAGHRAAVRTLHSALPFSPGAAKLTLRFLRLGRFTEDQECTISSSPPTPVLRA